jgi:hypothetical protein
MDLSIAGLQSSAFNIDKIERSLRSLGLTGIEKRLVDGRVVALVFSVKAGDRFIMIKLPFKWQYVQSIHNISDERAYRVCCGVIRGWIDDVVPLVESGNVSIAEVFLPFMYSEKHGMTFFEMMMSKNFEWGDRDDKHNGPR